MFKMNKLFSILACLFCLTSVQAQQSATEIRVNQLGFLPNATKIAVVKDAVGTSFEIKTADGKKNCF